MSRTHGSRILLCAVAILKPHLQPLQFAADYKLPQQWKTHVKTVVPQWIAEKFGEENFKLIALDGVLVPMMVNRFHLNQYFSGLPRERVGLMEPKRASRIHGARILLHTVTIASAP